VIPRAAIPDYLAKVAEIAAAHETFVSGCGHVGDGNVHLGVFQPDVQKRKALTREIFRIAVEAGGAISGEHGLGTEKMPYYLEMADPVALELMRSIKKVFDPLGILGPERMLGLTQTGETS
jgi:glycolate oxidase